MIEYLFYFFLSFFVSFAFLKFWLSFALKKKIVGIDVQKPDKPEIPEMGGLVLIFSIFIFFLFYLLVKLISHSLSLTLLEEIISIFSSLLMISLIGTFDDLFDLGQLKKALLSLLAGFPFFTLPLETNIFLPFLGFVYLGRFFQFVLVPIGISGASNAFDMLAGYNGLESGLMVLIFFTLFLISFHLGHQLISLLLLVSLSSSLILWFYNRYPSKIFVGDVGTMTAGAIISISVILGNFKWAGIIIFIPFFIDFFIKIFHRLPKTFGEYRKGKLYCPTDGPKGLGQLVMKIFGGIKEKNLVNVLLLFEAIFCLISIIIYW